MKVDLRQRKDGQYKEQYAELQERMRQLEKSALEHRKARHVTLRRIAELQAGEETFELEQLECEREAWEVERGLQLEKISRQNMEIQHIVEERRRLEDEQRSRIRRLDAIHEETLRRRREKEHHLDHVLKCASHLGEHTGDGTVPIGAGVLGGTDGGEDMEEVSGRSGLKDSMLAKISVEIDVARRRAAHESAKAHEALRRKLNEERFSLAGQKDVFASKRRQVHAKCADGLKEFARGELGPAAFRILETPAPPEATSTWGALKSSNFPAAEGPKKPANGGAEEERGGTALSSSGRRRSDGTRDSSSVDDNSDSEEEAREDAGRAAAIAPFLRVDRHRTPASSRKDGVSQRISATKTSVNKTTEAPTRESEQRDTTTSDESLPDTAKEKAQRTARRRSREEEDEGSEGGIDVARDVEGLIADLRTGEGDSLSRIEQLRAEVKALVEEEQWLTEGALGKGHAWETVAQLVGESQPLRGGKGSGTNDQRLGLQTDRTSLEVATRIIQEEERLARREEEVLHGAQTILEEHVAEEINDVHAELKSACAAVLGVVGGALVSAAAAAALRSRDDRAAGASVVKDPDAPVRELLVSSCRALALNRRALREYEGDLGGGGGDSDEGGDIHSGGGDGRAPTLLKPRPSGRPMEVRRLKDIQWYRPPRHPKLAKAEQYFFARIPIETASVAVPKDDGMVTAVAVSPAAGASLLLAAGTSKGGIAVWAIPCKSDNTDPKAAAVLVRVASAASLRKDERRPVKSLVFGADGHSQLVSVHGQETTRIWDLTGKEDAGTARHPANRGGGGKGSANKAVREFLPEFGVGAKDKNPTPPLIARCTIRESDLRRPQLNAGTAAWLENANRAERSEAVAHKHGNEGSGLPSSSKRDTRASVAAFHTAMTAFGDQHSVVIGTAGGSVVKCNADAWVPAPPGSEGDIESGVVYGRCGVFIEPGESGAPYESMVVRKRPPSRPGEEGERNGRGDLSVNAETSKWGDINTVRREFFERHRSPVVFVGFRDRVSLSMITLDASGLLCVWSYSVDAFCGFGWYTPAEEIVLNVNLHHYAEGAKGPSSRGKGGSGGGGGAPAFIFNQALPTGSAETEDPQEAIDALTSGGFQLWSDTPTTGGGRSEMYVCPSGNEDSGDASALVARYDSEGEIKSVARLRTIHDVREGRITDAKLTVSGGELAVMASYPPQNARGGVSEGHPTEDKKASDFAASSSAVVIFLVDLQSLALLPQHVRHDWVAEGPSSIFFVVSPVLDVVGSDYVYLMAEDKILMFSFETGQEVFLNEGRRLSFYTKGSPVVAADVSSDNGNLAVACAGSGTVLLLRLRDDTMGTRRQPRRQPQETATDDGAASSNSSSTAVAPSWQSTLRAMPCDRRDATPWEMRAHRITLFKMDINRFGHRREIARIVSGIQEAAMTLSEEGNEQYQNKRGNGGVGGAGGRVVSLRALLGEPPYGTV